MGTGRVRRSGIAVAGMLAVLLGAAGCGSGSVARDDVAAQISSQLEAQVGQAPDSVTCPEDLPAEVGASIRCELTAGGDVLGVTATVTSVEGETVNFDIQVDEVPAAVPQ